MNMSRCSNEYENEFWPENKYILGIDEAGRGPLAGPLTVAGVILPIGYDNEDIYDSKAISHKKREALYDLIIQDAIWYDIVQVSPEDIDRYDIYHADQRVMEDIANRAKCDVVLVDAMPINIEGKIVFNPTKGDQKSINIAAASILAKVSRDRIMAEYDEIYPGYGFKNNKGYPTKAHMEAIEEIGITPIHRKSFAPVRNAYIKQKLF